VEGEARTSVVGARMVDEAHAGSGQQQQGLVGASPRATRRLSRAHEGRCVASTGVQPRVDQARAQQLASVCAGRSGPARGAAAARQPVEGLRARSAVRGRPPPPAGPALDSRSGTARGTAGPHLDLGLAALIGGSRPGVPRATAPGTHRRPAHPAARRAWPPQLLQGAIGPSGRAVSAPACAREDNLAP
jgi:hypothetical protein